MYQIRVKILYNKKIQDYYFHLIIEAPKIIRVAKPGQFVNIRLNDGYEPLLRRPFSIHRVKGKNIEILYEIVGKGTEILSQKKTGGYLDIIGPLGNGFSYELSAKNYQTSILVAGGMGVAPLIFLAEKLVELKTQNSKLQTIVLLGAKTRNDILCEKEFKQLGYNVKISTDDGSRGFKGKMTDLLIICLRLHVLGMRHATCDMRHATRIYACGPRPMLKEIGEISKKYGIPAQVSLEEHMACGIGACLGCVVNTRDGYKRVCKEGPVFKTDEIIW